MLSEEEIEAAENGMDPTQVGKQRGLSNSKYRKWPGGVVPYTLDEDAGNCFNSDYNAFFFTKLHRFRDETAFHLQGKNLRATMRQRLSRYDSWKNLSNFNR